MSIEKIRNIGLDKLVTQVYDFDSLTTDELMCKFAQKINIIIEHFNYLDKQCQNNNENIKLKLEYLLGQGLEEQVAKRLLELINNGTLGKLINETLLKDINDKVDNFKVEVNEQLETIVQGLKSTYNYTVSEMVGISNPLNPSEDLLIKIRDCGIKYYRIDLMWENIEVIQGVYNFQNSTINYDNLNSLLKKYDLIPYYILGYTNTIYGNEGNITSENMTNGYINYVKACVDRYKNQNCVWEIYNEANTEKWKNSSPKNYTNLVKKIYPIIKDIDSTSIVAVGALGNTLSYSLEFFDKMCSYGVLDYCDIISTHPYSNEKPELLNDYWGEFYGVIGKYTNRNIPIWCGEVGYSDVPNWDGNGNNAVVSPTNKINFTLRQILNNVRNGIEKTIIYCATDRNGSNANVENYFGIFDYNGNYKDVSNEIKTLLNEIGDYYFIEEIETNNINNYVMKFTDGKNVKYVAWCINNNSKIILENKECLLTERPQVILSSNSSVQINNSDNIYLKSKYSALAISNKNLNSYKDEINNKLEIIDKTGSPGLCYLKSGSKENGFFGLVSPVEMGKLNNGDLYNGESLAAKVNIGEGVSANPNCPLMKFIIDGKILFIPLKPYRYNIYWDTIYNNGCVFGTTDEGYCPKGSRSGKDLWIDSTDNSINTTTQKFNSHVVVGAVGDTLKLDGWKNSNNNTTATIVSITDTKIVVSGVTLTSEQGNINSRISNLKYNVNQNKDVEIGNYTYRVRLIKTGELILNSYSDDYRGTISNKNEWNRLILPLHEKCVSGWTYTQYAKDSNLKDIIYQYANLSDEDLNTINSLNGSYTWTQNASDTETWKRAFRGALGAEFIDVEDENNRNNAMAWRPVLELIK